MIGSVCLARVAAKKEVAESALKVLFHMHYLTEQFVYRLSNNVKVRVSIGAYFVNNELDVVIENDNEVIELGTEEINS